MKLSLIKFIANYSETISEMLKNIESAESYDRAKAHGNLALGYTDALCTLVDTFDDKPIGEPNEPAEELEELIVEWKHKAYSAVLMVAVKTCQPAEEISRVAELRDEWTR